MSILLKRNRIMLPSSVNDYFNTERLFPSIFDYDQDLLDLNRDETMSPSANIYEDETNFEIEIAVPGMEREDFKVQMDKGILTVSAEKEEDEEEDTKNYWRREFQYNAFSRSFSLPDNTMPDKINARYENGMLCISLPKKEVTILKNTAKEIEVL
jgi:HSP20 family protein